MYKKLFDRATPNTQHTQARSSVLELGAVMMAMMGAPSPPARRLDARRSASHGLLPCVSKISVARS